MNNTHAPMVTFAERIQKLFTVTALAVVWMLSTSAQALADGTETLGTPSIAIASGSGIVAAGTGMVDQPGTIDIAVPAGATVNQVLLYWEGQMSTDVAGDDSILINGNNVTGTLIGGQVFFFNNAYSSAFRADITGLGLVSAGANSLTVDDLIFTKVANGAGILVVFDDGSGLAEIDIRDGLDNAFINFSGARQSTVPQTITFAPAGVDRVANFDLFFSSVSGTVSGSGADRPSSIEVTVNGTTTVFSNELASLDGEEWDTVNIGFDIPAGASSLTVQAFSRDDNGDGQDPLAASFTWTAAGLSIQPPAALGDRVWEDLNANGIQDCQDTNGNGIIGDSGDLGLECDAGIPEVPVTLLAGDCQTPRGQMVMTDMNGFYLFPNLNPGDYCVEFGKPPVDFCDTDGFDLGEPQFTTQNAGNDAAIDSDADTGTGVTDPVNLKAGETNLTVDAGIFCPAKIGDRVWLDENENGIQDDGPGGVEGVKVTLFECGDDMVAGTSDDVMTGQMRNTGTDGMYMFGGEPNFTLDPGKYFVQFMKPDGTEFTTPNVNGDDINSDCLPPDGNTTCTTLGSRGINLDRDCGLIPPPLAECDIDLDKKCRVETPPVSGDLECEAKIAASVLEYTGSGTPSEVTVTGKDKKSQVVSSFDAATGILTVDARPGDLGSKMTITTDGVEEVIHTSCSAPYVAGQPAPLDNPKGAPSDNWLVLSFVDKNGGSASVPGDSDGMFTDNCTFTPAPAPSCATLKANKQKLSSLTFAYTGGGCDGDNDQGDKSSCSGSIDPVEGVTVQAGEKVDNLNYPVQPMFVAPDGEFTIDPDKFKSNSVLVASNTDGTETNEFHTSCSQPLAVGDVFGSFTLVAINGQHGSTEVTYQYKVTNNGDPLTGIVVTDVPLGDIGTIPTLGKGASDTLSKTVRILGTTSNTGTATGTVDGVTCSASDTVVVEVTPPPSGGTECTTKIAATSLRYTGPDLAGATVVFEPKNKKSGTVTYSNVDLVSGVTILSMPEENGFTIDERPNDLGSKLTIKVDGEIQEVHHTSCSVPYIAGQPAPLDGNSPGNPSKGDPSPNWFVEGFEQK